MNTEIEEIQVGKIQVKGLYLYFLFIHFANDIC